MNRLVQAAVVTAGVGLSLVAPASAQMIVRFDAPPPPIPASLARDLRRLGVALPRDRVRGVVQVRQSARDGRIEVRFGEAGSAPKPRQAARNALREPVAASAKPPLPAPRKAAPDVQARPETAASQESSAWADPPAAPVAPAPGVPAAPAPVAQGGQAVSEALGEWLVADGSARVDVRPCGVNLCGIVSWSKSNEGIGTEVLRGMKPVGEHRWEGPVFDPRSGKTYQSAVILTGDRLRVEGCLMGFLCGGETWTRAG